MKGIRFTVTIKEMKKILTVFLTITLLLSAFTACANIEYDDGSSFVPDYESADKNNSSVTPDSNSSTIPATSADTSSDGEGDSSDSLNSTPDESSTFTDIADNGEAFNNYNNILLLGDRCMDVFGGTYDSFNYYSQVIAQYKKDLGTDVDVYSMIVPTSNSIYLRNYVRDGVDFYQKYGGNQEDKLDYVDEKFEGTGVISVNVYDALYEHWDEQIYFRTDFHWTQLGAYYAAEKFASVSGLPFKTLDSGSYTKQGKYNEDGSPQAFYGYYYSKLGYPTVIKDNPDEFFWFEYNEDYSVEYYDVETGKKLIATTDTCYLNVNHAASWYMTFIGGDNRLAKISTGTKNGKTAVVFKDSFGNCFAPLLMSMYETIYVVDFRYYTGNSISFCKDVNATDVIFALSSSSACSYSKTINSMRTR